MVALNGILFAKELGLLNNQVEGDSSNFINGLKSLECLLSSFGHIIQAARNCLRHFLSSPVSYVPRLGNYVAHCLSRLASDYQSLRVWNMDGGCSTISFLLGVP